MTPSLLQDPCALLNRSPLDELNTEGIADVVRGKRVLVTGAGGSIGAQICREIVKYNCEHLSLLENSEAALFNIDRELADTGASLQAIMCDVRDRKRLESWFLRERPDVVFHAAAMKHLRLSEDHPCEAVLTNVMGTWNVARAARAAKVAHTVVVSTDKAVMPISMMGATKRAAELIVRNLATDRARFAIVRLGNVLGSSGSVFPEFVRQIQRGGPVTISHEQVERYFITHSEAALFSLKSLALSVKEEALRCRTFALDMGAPVKIMGLAKRLIDLLGGATPANIEIGVTGLRAWEKLSEDLVWPNETPVQLDSRTLELMEPEAPRLPAGWLARLEAAARSGDEPRLRAELFGWREGRLGPVQ